MPSTSVSIAAGGTFDGFDDRDDCRAVAATTGRGVRPGFPAAEAGLAVSRRVIGDGVAGTVARSAVFDHRDSGAEGDGWRSDRNSDAGFARYPGARAV